MSNNKLLSVIKISNLKSKYFQSNMWKLIFHARLRANIIYVAQFSVLKTVEKPEVLEMFVY